MVHEIAKTFTTTFFSAYHQLYFANIYKITNFCTTVGKLHSQKWLLAVPPISCRLL